MIVEEGNSDIKKTTQDRKALETCEKEAVYLIINIRRNIRMEYSTIV